MTGYLYLFYLLIELCILPAAQVERHSKFQLDDEISQYIIFCAEDCVKKCYRSDGFYNCFSCNNSKNHILHRMLYIVIFNRLAVTTNVALLLPPIVQCNINYKISKYTESKMRLYTAHEAYNNHLFKKRVNFSGKK